MRKEEGTVPMSSGYRRMYRVEPVRLSIRKSPSLNAEIVKIINQGDLVEQTGEDDGIWMRVRGGYVMSEFVAAAG